MLTVVLFVGGGQPAASHLFPGVMHWVAHLATYAIIAVAYAYALPRLGILGIAALVATIGGVHEYYEISAHSHEFEYLDAAVNGVGALAGSIAAHATASHLRR